MRAHDDSSIERNRQPTVLDNSVLASGLVSAGLPRGARRRVFTPSAINTIRGLAGQGKSASEIAEVIGSTTGSVQVKCSQLRIKLRRHAGLPRGARRRVFTPSTINTICGLAGQGKSASEIAEVIGSTTGSVQVKCSQLKIRLRRQGRRGHIRQIAGQRLIICLSDADYAALKRKAADMQKSAVKLSGELLEAIISSDIYEAVLDDDK
jgi:DNA-binding CsgD family transcriptional regulator